MTGDLSSDMERTRDLKKPVCSVVIRAYNEEKQIGRLLTGLAQQTILPDEIILVDSGSTDGTLAVVSKYPVQIMHIPAGEFTFGRSLNLGIDHARGDIIIIASAHVHPVYPDWLEWLLTPFKDARIGLVYGKQRGNAHAKFSEQQIFKQWYPEQSQLRQTHPFCNNANAAIQRKMWEKHPYNETLTGLEDIEWARWAMEQGKSISYSAEAEVIHNHDETPRGIYNRYRREAMAFKCIFPHERFGFGDFIRLIISNIANDTSSARREGVLSKNLGSIFWFRWMQFWGTYQGYRHPGPVTKQLRKTFYFPSDHMGKSSDPTRNVTPIHYEK